MAAIYSSEMPNILLRISRQKAVSAASTIYISRRHESSIGVFREQHSNLAAYKRGRGGRSSFSGIVATVLGCSGFVGRYVVNKLGKVGSQVICPYRGDPYFVKELKLCGDLGQVLFMPYSLRDEESLRKVMQHSNVVINLIGRDWETRNFTFTDVHVDGARRIARLAREMEVDRLIHFSHLSVSPNPKPVVNSVGSEYLKTKYQGEQAVLEEYPDATIFRPSDIFGPEDRFIRYYCHKSRLGFMGMPMWKKGTQTVKRPVFVADVAQGVVNAITEPDTYGKVIECVGPRSYLLSELVDYFKRCTRHAGFVRSHMTPMFKMKVAMYERMLRANPILLTDKLEREFITDVVHGYLTLEDLGVTLTKLEDRAVFETKGFRMSRSYEEAVGEFPEPAPPPVYAAA